MLVNSWHYLMEPFCVDQDYFDDVRELFLVHLVHKLFLLFFQDFVVFRELVFGKFHEILIILQK